MRFVSIDLDAPPPPVFKSGQQLVFAAVESQPPIAEHIVNRLEYTLGAIGVRSLSMYISPDQLSVTIIYRNGMAYQDTLKWAAFEGNPELALDLLYDTVIAYAQQQARELTNRGELIWPGSDVIISRGDNLDMEFQLSELSPAVCKGEMVVLQPDGTVALASRPVSIPFGTVEGTK